MIKKVINVVAYLFFVDPKDLTSESQSDIFVTLRGMVAYIIRNNVNDKESGPFYTLKFIGDALGGRKSSSLTHAVKTFENDLRNNIILRKKLNEVINIFTREDFEEFYNEVLDTLTQRKRNDLYLYKTMNRDQFQAWWKFVLTGDPSSHIPLIDEEIEKLKGDRKLLNRKITQLTNLKEDLEDK